MPATPSQLTQAEPSLGAGLERKWEEAWRRARAGDYKGTV